MGAACYRFEVLAKLINDVKPITNPVCCAVFSISLPPLAGRARAQRTCCQTYQAAPAILDIF